MRLINLKNVSSGNVQIKQPSGAKFMLTPGNEVKHIEVSNLHEVLGKVEVRHDLTEVSEPRPGRTRIDG